MRAFAELLARVLLACAALALVVWLLRAGNPLGALIVAVAATTVRRSAESGRLHAVATRVVGHR